MTRQTKENIGIVLGTLAFGILFGQVLVGFLVP